MRGRARGAIGAALVAGLMMVGVGQAQAATTIGETGTDGNFDCVDTGVVQAATAVPPDYTAPSAGVITSWSHAVGTTGGSGKLLVVRDTPFEGTFGVAAKSDALAFDVAGIATQAVRIPVLAGDRLAIRNLGTVDQCFFKTSEGGDVIKTDSGSPEPDVGGELVTGIGNITTFRANVSAVVEPDVDGDGFGDETQDLCPSNGTTAGACPPPPDPALVTFDRTLNISYKKQKFFKGKVKSEEDTCTSKVKVKVFNKQRGGKTKKVGADKTSAKGVWKIKDKNAKPGKYFARVAETTVSAGICEEQKSKNVTVK